MERSAESSHSFTTTTTTNESRLILRLQDTRPNEENRVRFTNDTVDNEHLNKKKSKCCCIFTKSSKLKGENSNEEDQDNKNDDGNSGECDHCSNHRQSDFQSNEKSTSSRSVKVLPKSN
ncbi:hypothetical protein GJ496_007768 [Pomphorhynchus laevis]|nr:hypothetical protein GJ496_007768 [Pomphorhynchus laevis]